MSFRKEQFLQYKKSAAAVPDSYLADLSEEELEHLFLEVLYNGVHGFCFSLYEEGQKPGDIISAAQIDRRIQILKRYTGWIRSFSCIEGNEHIPILAKQAGLKTLVGAWLGSDEEKNQQEIAALIKLANEGYVDIAAVGNEVLYRKDLTEEQLLAYIAEVKKAIPQVPVGYVDAYYEFVKRPQIAEMCDVILCNCYPYWEGTAFENSLPHMQEMYRQAKTAANGKRVVITETGWPSQGESLGNAIPSRLHAIKYFLNTQLWAHDQNIEVFYFSSFDESWKISSEGEVGAYWGIWDSLGKLKYQKEHV
ncbi:glycosyl hydrolase [Sphingobacteriales bacterium UPWRP_1]|nr:glycosyl hydrolase [Sphingobacteriales bacterium TSM_CSM]PSJ76125.1 glycosyl hydrolase [Sphingobacteriales bacterium UPWRP_1]